MRIYLTGRVTVEADNMVLRENQFPSRQARLLFAYLVSERVRPAARDELAELLWPDKLPSAWDSGLKSLISKLRLFLNDLADSPQAYQLTSQFGCYQLQLPSDSWIDVEAARNSIDEAEGALRAGDVGQSWGPTNVALTISKGLFLPGEEGEWVDFKRRELGDIRLRAFDCYANIALRTDQPRLAIQTSQEAIRLEPFRETSYQMLMRAHVASDSRAEALRVYHECQNLLRNELGVDPSPETQSIYLAILGSPSPA